MGKLGGGELNFSSDIDLVLLYPEGGRDRWRARRSATRNIFTRLGQQLIRLLEQPTEDGFVFRVDLRLRPYGDSGPLVIELRPRSRTTCRCTAATGSAMPGSRRAR